MFETEEIIEETLVHMRRNSGWINLFLFFILFFLAALGYKEELPDNSMTLSYEGPSSEDI